ncbi:hypothetical protein ROHU_027588 [Labeo rohita]|uniref:Uncharacterized protein n=1 Tax=Labeo rohita TaxID=84645 RepID=A0A498M5Y3_LABRO|nr:hypothetical protein ROHU_027588 [Labeo rohita]
MKAAPSICPERSPKARVGKVDANSCTHTNGKHAINCFPQKDITVPYDTLRVSGAYSAARLWLEITEDAPGENTSLISTMLHMCMSMH